LVVASACGDKREPKPAESATTTTVGSGAIGGSNATGASIGSSNATGSSAVGANGSGSNARGSNGLAPAGNTRPGRAIAIASSVPDFGCLGWSPDQNVAACVVGQRGTNIGGTQVEVALVPLTAKADAGDPVKLLDLGDNDGRGPDELPPPIATRLASTLRGFVSLDRNLAHISSTNDDGKLIVSAPVSVGGMVIAVRSEPAGRQVFAPANHVVLSVRFADGTKRVLADRSDAIHTVDARAFALHGAVIVELVYATGDEGTYGSYGSVWRCSATDCEP